LLETGKSSETLYCTRSKSFGEAFQLAGKAKAANETREPREVQGRALIFIGREGIPGWEREFFGTSKLETDLGNPHQRHETVASAFSRAIFQGLSLVVLLVPLECLAD
jgi:hypothetical protein